MNERSTFDKQVPQRPEPAAPPAPGSASPMRSGAERSEAPMAAASTPAPVAGATGSAVTMSISSVLESLIGDFPDVSISKIRFLETRGLITPDRAPSGYRRFSEADVSRLRWILTMQRDHFLPLRVIKERLDAGADTSEVPGAGLSVTTAAPTRQAMSSSGAPTPATVPAQPPSRFRAPGPDTDRLDATEVARLAGLTGAQLDELVKFGLVDPAGGPDEATYSRDELRVAKAAGGFLAHGIEARHLKSWRIAAEREASLLDQIILPLSRQKSADAAERAREVADELIDLGNTIREAILVQSLRRTLGDAVD